MLKIFYKIYIFLIFSISIFGQGMGDLDISINMTPAGVTKKYIFDDSILLDTGTKNSTDIYFPFNGSEKIADVTVIMHAKKNNSPDTGKYCVIDGDFNTLYKLRELEELEGKIETSNLKKYSQAEKTTITLYQKNFKRLKETVIANESKESEYYKFVAYPDECINGKNGEKQTNIVVIFAYSFEIWMEVSGAQKGDIVKTDVGIDSKETTSETVGTLKDLVKDQFRKLQ